MSGPLAPPSRAFLSVRGRAIAPGLACGPLRRNRIDLPPREAEGTILLAERAVPEDVPRLLVAAGILTFEGAVLSHVSLLCREFGKPSISFGGLTPARYSLPGEGGLLVLEAAGRGTEPVVLAEGDIVFLDGSRGEVMIPGGLDPAARAAVRRVYLPLLAFGKRPEDEALLAAVLAACPASDPTALAFLVEAALLYRAAPAGPPARRLIAALGGEPERPGLSARLETMRGRTLAEAAARCEEARDAITSVDDQDELQRTIRNLEASLQRDLALLDDLDADPDRLEASLEPVLAAAAARRGVLDARLRNEIDRALALSDEALRMRLGSLFRLLRRARAASVDEDTTGRLHQRLSRELAAERARAGTHLVVPLAPAGPSDRGLVGGKAAAILDVMHALPPGVRVPPGFVITSAAYRLHLLGEIGEKLRLALEGDDEASIARQARAAILGAPIPEEVVAALREAFDRLGHHRLAVRSSATIEDGPLGSLAGLFDTYLGVLGFQDLLDRVRWAWASLWNGRALTALVAAGTAPLRAAQAVIVQEMVATRAAGVLFSRDPAGRPDTLLVNAAWGLGEGISQGEVPGDLFWVRRSSGEILAAETGRGLRRIELAPKGIGTVEVALDGDQVGKPCLTPHELSRLAALARALEEVTGRAQDIEFGLDDDGGVVIFQTRRIVPRRAR